MDAQRRSRTEPAEAVLDEPRVTRALPLVVAAFAAALGTTVLVGWAVGSRTMTSLAPSLPTMKVNTAIGFLLSAATMALLRDPTPVHRRLAALAGGVLALFALLTLSEWVAGRSFGIDQWAAQDGTSGAGRPSALTSIAFACLAVTQLTLDAQRPLLRRTRVLFGCGFVVTVLLAAVGYLYGSDALTGRGRVPGVGPTGMALTTAAGLLVLLVGLVAQRPDRDPARRLRGSGPAAAMLRRVIPAVLVLTPLLGALRLLGQQAGLYDTRFGLALFTISVIVGFVGLSLRAAAMVDRYEAERRLAAYASGGSERRFRALASLAPVGIFEADREGAIVYFNARMCEITGLSAFEALGPGWTRSVHPEDRERVLAQSNSAAALMGEVAIEYRVLRPDMSVAWVSARCIPIIDRDGLISGFIGTCSDVTELKDAERTARETEARLQALLDHAPIPMSLRALDGRFVLVNRYAAEMMGRTVEEVLRLPPAELYDPDTARLIDEHERPVRTGEGAITFEMASPDRSGEVHDYFVTKYPVTDGAGHLVGVGGISLDITDRRRAEETLRDTNHQLETANRAKDRFLSSMSHELRTPLNAVLGFTGTLLMGLHGELTEEQRTPLLTVQRTGRHLLSLINDLLDLARIESGKLELKREPIDCRELLDDVVVGLRPLADEKGLVLDVAPRAQPVELLGDRRAVSQILINIANNAIKFTDRGSVRLELDQHLKDDRCVTRFAVVDTGRGIAPGDQQRLFAAFEQIGSADSRPFEGTGLGLFISQTLAGMMGGEITFESVPGEGSTFALEVTGAVA